MPQHCCGCFARLPRGSADLCNDCSANGVLVALYWKDSECRGRSRAAPTRSGVPDLRRKYPTHPSLCRPRVWACGPADASFKLVDFLSPVKAGHAAVLGWQIKARPLRRHPSRGARADWAARDGGGCAGRPGVRGLSPIVERPFELAAASPPERGVSSLGGKAARPGASWPGGGDQRENGKCHQRGL